MPNNAHEDSTQSTTRQRAIKTDRRWRTVRGYLVLPHLFAVVVVMLATAAFAVIAWRGVPPLRLLTPLLLAMLGGQLVIGVTNEIVDFADDVRYKPDKPLARGDVSLRGAEVMLLAGLGLMISSGLLLGWPSFALLILGSGLGIAYDLWLKRTRWSWLPYFLALPLVPIWVFVTLDRAEPPLLLLYPLGALATIGVHFAQALPDVSGDRAAGLVTPTSQLGVQRVFWFGWLATISAPMLAWIAAGWLDVEGDTRAILVAMAVTLVLMALDLAVTFRNRNAGFRLCFPLIALATLVSGMAWVVTVTS